MGILSVLFTVQILTIAIEIAVISTLYIFVFYIVFRRFKKKNKTPEKISETLQDEDDMTKESEMNYKEEYDRILKAVYDEHLYADQNLGRDSFAAQMNLSRHALNRIISSNTSGQSFPQWINTIRLEIACDLLRNKPAKPVGEIANEVGLTANNFYRLFRLQFGITPVQYRQEGTEKNGL